MQYRIFGKQKIILGLMLCQFVSLVSLVSYAESDANGWSWIYQQPKENYTIQIFASKKQESTTKFIRQYALVDQARAIRAIVNGTQYYKVVYGSFEKWNDAAIQIGKLPQGIREQRPWVRKFSAFYPEIPKEVVITKSTGVVNGLEKTGSKVQQTEPINEIDSQVSAQQSLKTKVNDTATITKVNTADEIKEQKNESAQIQQTTSDLLEKKVAKLDKPEDETEESVESINENNTVELKELVASKIKTPSEQTKIVIEATQSPLPDYVDDETISGESSTYARQYDTLKGVDVDTKNQLISGLESIRSENYAQAFEHLSPLVDKGVGEAQYRVAFLYYEGKGVEQNLTEAFNLMKQASIQGHPYAQQKLGEFYTKGIGVDANPMLGEYWNQSVQDKLRDLKISNDN